MEPPSTENVKPDINFNIAASGVQLMCAVKGLLGVATPKIHIESPDGRLQVRIDGRLVPPHVASGMSVLMMMNMVWITPPEPAPVAPPPGGLILPSRS